MLSRLPSFTKMVSVIQPQFFKFGALGRKAIVSLAAALPAFVKRRQNHAQQLARIRRRAGKWGVGICHENHRRITSKYRSEPGLVRSQGRLCLQEHRLSDVIGKASRLSENRMPALEYIAVGLGYRTLPCASESINRPSSLKEENTNVERSTFAFSAGPVLCCFPSQLC